MVAVYVAVNARVDARPVGELGDIPSLAEREDLNVLFILIDTLRADRLGCYGYARDTSPHIDAMARAGIRFGRHQAQSSWTKASMASLWTSLYPARSGVLHATHALSEEAQLPAEILRAEGFRTAGIWRNGWVAPNFGFAQGFELYLSPRPGAAIPGFRRENPGARLRGTDFDVIASAEEFLRAHDQERWFLYLHLMDLHQYATDEHSARFGTTYSDAYDNAIHFTDRAVGALLEVLARRDLLDKTLIALVSDHGEAFGEHGSEGHARDVHSEVITTPWILSLPFRLEPGLVVETPSENVDLWPTLLELVGISGPTSPADGVSQVARILGTEAPTTTTQIAHIDRAWARKLDQSRAHVSLSSGAHRLLYDGPHAALYDVTTDPWEQTDIASEHPELVDRLRGLAESYLAATPPWQGGTPRVELDDMQLGQLRALGYVVDAP
jgi:arylsulfatase A-like enzyme